MNTHTRSTALCPGLPRSAGTRKAKPIWFLLKQETVSGSGSNWAVCKSAPSSRQIATPAPNHSVFYRPDALPAAHPTASKHWRQPSLTWTCQCETEVCVCVTIQLIGRDRPGASPPAVLEPTCPLNTPLLPHASGAAIQVVYPPLSGKYIIFWYVIWCVFFDCTADW